MTSTDLQPPKTSSSSPSTPTTAPQPISLLPTSPSRTFTHIHAIAILSLLSLRFSALVSDPAPALFVNLIPLVALQYAYVVICLPVAGAGVALNRAALDGKQYRLGVLRRKNASLSSSPSKADGGGGVGSKITSAVLSAFLALGVGTAVLAVLMILFGAPITTHLPETVAAAMHLSLLAGMPLVYVHGVDGDRWKRIVGAEMPLDEVFGATVGTLVGAWLGAVPIPLDWDREWQKWPVTIVVGAYAGCVLGKLLGGLVLKGKTIRLD